MSSEDLKAQFALKDVVMFATIIASSAGFYFLTNHRLQSIEGQLGVVKELREANIRAEAKFDKIDSLGERITSNANNATERMNNQQERTNVIAQDLRDLQASQRETSVKTEDRIRRTEVERWILRLQRALPDQQIPDLE